MLGSRVLPCLARPVPFCRYGLAPPPRTVARVLVLAVPCLPLASWRRYAWCMTGTLGFSSKIALGRSTSPLRSPRASKYGACTGILFLDLPRVRLARRALRLDLLGRLLDEHERPLRAGNAPPDHQEVAVGIHADDLVGAGGAALVAHLAGHAHALEDASRVRGADRPRLADVHRAVRLRAAAELVALDQALKALALARASHVDELTGLEDLGGDVLTLLEAVVVADLDHVSVRIQAGLLELAELGVVQLSFLDGEEGDAGGRVAV